MKTNPSVLTPREDRTSNSETIVSSGAPRPDLFLLGAQGSCVLVRGVVEWSLRLSET